MNELVASPFANAKITARPSGGSNAVAQTDQQRAIAEVQAAMVIARYNPRDPVAAMDRILNACTRPTLADAAVYQYARGGSDISGPSIRLAEAMAQQWGNIKTSVRELEQSNGVSTVQTIAWDLETGYQCDKVFQVPHIRYTRQGAKRLEDPRDIYELIANQGSRRLRACILAVIPGDVTEAAVTQCELTMKAKADTSPDAMGKMVEAFKVFGVVKEQIEKRIQRRIDAIQSAQVMSLKKVYASLRDGMSSAADWFDPVEPTSTAGSASAGGGAGNGVAPHSSGTAAAKEAIMKQRQSQHHATPATTPVAKPEVIDPADNPETGADPTPAHAAPVVQAAAVLDKMLKAKTLDALDEAADLVGAVADAAQRRELTYKYDALRAELL